MAAAKAMLSTMVQNPELFTHLHKVGNAVQEGVKQELDAAGVPVVAQSIEPMFQFWSSDEPISNYREAVMHSRHGICRVLPRHVETRGVPSSPIRDLVCLNGAHRRRPGATARNRRGRPSRSEEEFLSTDPFFQAPTVLQTRGSKRQTVGIADRQSCQEGAPSRPRLAMSGCVAPRDVLFTIGNEILETSMSSRSRRLGYLCYPPLLEDYFEEAPNRG